MTAPVGIITDIGYARNTFHASLVCPFQRKGRE